MHSPKDFGTGDWGSILDKVHESILSVDLDGLITGWNKGAERQFGYSAEEAIGSHVSKLYAEDWETVEREVIRPLQANGNIDLVKPLIRKSGEVFDGHVSASLVTAPDGVVTGMIGYVLDISEQKKAERALRQYQRMVSASPDLMSFVGPDYRYIAVNDAYVEAYGRPKSEILGHRISDFIGQDKFDSEIKPKLDTCLAGASGRWSGWFEYPELGMRCKDFTFDPVRDDDGAIIGVAASIRDITDLKQAERELRRVGSERSHILKNANIAITLTKDRKIVAIDDAAENFWGWSAEECRAMGGQVFYARQEEFERVGREAGPIIGAGKSYETEVTLKRKDGSTFPARVVGSAVNPDDPDEGVIWLTEDITSRKQAEANLRESESRLADAQHAAHLGNWEYDIAQDTVWWSDETYRLFGMTPGESAPNRASFLEYLPPEDVEAMQVAVQKAIELGFPFSLDHGVVRRDGEHRVFHSHGVAVRDDAGAVVRLKGINQDITERKRAEERLRRSESGLAEAQRIAHLGNWEYDIGAGALYWSDETFRLLGLVPEDFTPSFEKYLDFIPATDKEQVVDAHRACLRDAAPVSIEHLVIRADGVERVVYEQAEPMLDGDGKVIGIAGTILDVTERKGVEDALQAAHDDLERRVDARTRELSATVDTLVEGVITIDDHGVIESFNRSAEKLFGYASNEIVGQNISVLMGGQNRSEHNTYLQRYRDSGEAKIIGTGREVVGQRKDGSTFDMRLGVGEMWIGGERKFVGTVHDISDQKRVAEALRKSEGMFRAITENTTDFTLVIDADGLFTYSSPAVERFSGYAAAEVIGQEYQSFAVKEDLEKIQPAFDEAIKKPGETVRVPHFRAYHRDGHMIDYEALVTNMMDVAGVEGIVVSLRDITTRKNTEAELVAAKEMAETANQAKSAFLSSMSHELRTPMNAILGFAQLLEQDKSKQLDETNREFVEEILRSGHHMLELINDILDLAKIEDSDVDLDLADHEPGLLIMSCLKMISPVAEKNSVTLTSKVSEIDLPKVQVDTLRFRQALLNLLSNAIKYNRDDGKVTINCAKAGNNSLRISVADTGPGIPENLRNRVFEPFDRLGAENSTTPGTGIGLAVSKQLIERMGGDIGFESKVGEGTTFWIDVPLAQTEQQAAS